MKNQVGIQKATFEVIKQSKRNELPYISKQQIINEVKDIIVLKEPTEQVGQALYQLQRKTKYRQPRIKKYFVNGCRTGWTVVNDMWLWED